jgi:uncharacterized RDD family membrane protein YckC
MTEPTGGAPNPPSPGSWQAPPPPTPTPTNFQQPAVDPGPAPGIAYADLGTRIVALIIDWMILVAFFLVVSVVLVFFGSIGQFLASLIFLAANAGYFIYTWTRMRATYGQKFLKLETVNAADGATLTQDQAIRRWLFLFGPSALVAVIGSMPIFVLAALGSLAGLLALGYDLYLLWTASQSPKRQGFHDVQASTVVVKRLA